jgi:RES domain-containing protein
VLGFRILHKRFGDALFAPGIEGRWNKAGQRVLYCSDSIPLAFMENMIRRKGVGFNEDYQIACIDIPDSSTNQKVEVSELTMGWNNRGDYSKCQQLAEIWYNSRKTLTLVVPSAALSVCYNYVINTTHPDFSKVKLIALTPLIPDPRINEILRAAKKP